MKRLTAGSLFAGIGGFDLGLERAGMEVRWQVERSRESLMATTYLCGGINGLSDAECRDWRESAKSLLKTKTLDPMRRDYRGREYENYREIVEGDMDDIQKCDFVLVNAIRPSWGTAMEVHLASRRRYVVAWTGDARVSPWLRYFCDELHPSLGAACDSINKHAAASDIK